MSEAVAPSTRRARIIVAYHGAAFRGLALNEGVPTVMGALLPALELVVRQPVELVMSGRTDAGVHAWGQVLSGDLPDSTHLTDIMRRINKLCAPDIAIRAIEWAEPTFNARLDATSRSYRYDVWNHHSPHPMLTDRAWHVPQPLDMQAMNAAAPAFIGEHDFSSFGRPPKVQPGAPAPSMTRMMYEMGWTEVEESMLRYTVRGSAFCHQQVRSMVGTLVDVGLGRIAAAAVPAILRAGDRAAAGQVAPPHGLTLWAVGYDGTRWDADQRA
ncbi:MAG TPA: tRNA pseudouridine(38-40) synthase TruA [Ilumatobacter sp.]|nr:tRNA pseudouridine(38-40) synthase TruA [Ilumatobacter sp.]